MGKLVIKGLKRGMRAKIRMSIEALVGDDGRHLWRYCYSVIEDPEASHDTKLKAVQILAANGFGTPVNRVELSAVEPDDDGDRGGGAAALLGGVLIRKMRGETLTETEEALIREVQARKSLPPRVTVEDADGNEVVPK